MDRNVRKKFDNGNEKVVSLWEVDWTLLPDDTVIRLFSCLNNRDRASLSSSCKPWWILSKSPCLWKDLDLRFNKCDAKATKSLASRCSNLQKLRFCGDETAASVINLKANSLREISINRCKGITDATLSLLVARHEALECLQIGPHVCRNISSSAVKVIALCCPNLKKLWLSGFNDVGGEAIGALAENCQNLTDIGLVDCGKVDVAVLGNVKTLGFLSVAGTTNINWRLASSHWSHLLNLVCLDVSRTNIKPRAVSELLLSCISLKVLCALACPSIEHNSTSINRRGKRLVAVFTDILRELAPLFIDTPKERGNVFIDCRKSNNFKDKILVGVLDWLEWTVCNSLLYVLVNKTRCPDDFWLHQGTILLLSFLQSPHEEVQERAATALQQFVVVDGDNADMEVKRGEVIVREGGILLILNLARSWQEGLQLESVKAISNFMTKDNMVKALLEEGGVNVLINIARSGTKTLVTQAVRGLRNISASKINKSAIAKAGVVRALLDVLAKWSNSISNESIMEMAAGSLAILARGEKLCMEVISVGVAPELVKLLKAGMAQGAQKQAVCCLTAMALHEDSNRNHAAERQEIGALEALVQLIRSHDDSVKLEAAIALMRLSFKEVIREAIAALGGVQALIGLANSCANDSHSLQAVAAGGLLGLSFSERISDAIGQEGGVTPLIVLARSDVEIVHQMAAGALWILAFNAENAMHIIDEDGFPRLIQLCSPSVSKTSRFMSALALANMFDTGLDELAMIGTSSVSTSNIARLESIRRVAAKAIKSFLKSYSDSQAFLDDASSSLPGSKALARVTKWARIQEMDHLKFSESHIGRFLTMLRHPSPILKSCGAFALLQLTIPGYVHMLHHANLLKEAGAPPVLRVTVTSASTPPEAKAFARIVLKNLEHNNVDHSN